MSKWFGGKATVILVWTLPKNTTNFQDLKNIDSDSGDIITLSDFSVSLEEISLKE